MKMAEILADSSIVPKDFQGRPGNVLIACQWGAELGLQPLQAMQSIAVINGRPSIWGDAMLGLVRGSGLLESISEEMSADGEVATCTVLRRGEREPVVRQFSMADAKKAGLAGKSGPWQQYPKRMLQVRARGFALRDAFPDVLRGIHIAEEARDTPVMRDVTPEDEASEPASASARVRGKIAARKSAVPSMDDVLTRIAAASTEDELTKVGADCGKLAGAEKDRAREAYRERLVTIRDTVQGDEPAHDETAERLGALARTIIADMSNAGAEPTLQFYADQVAEIEAKAPDLHAEIMAAADELSGDGAESGTP